VKPGDIYVGATLVVALRVVALGRHKACPYGVGDAGDVLVDQVEEERKD
jgi:hypothetical protein